MGYSGEKIQAVKEQVLKAAIQVPRKMGKTILHGYFCAGMTSTQRSESANHMLKRFIQRAAPMHLFVAKFNEFQSDRNDQESKESFVTNQVMPKNDGTTSLISSDLHTKKINLVFCSPKKHACLFFLMIMIRYPAN